MLESIEKQRLRLYGDLLRRDFLEKNELRRQEKQRESQREAEFLSRHIEFTREFEKNRRNELKEENLELYHSNLSLSRNPELEHEHPSLMKSPSFLSEIHSRDILREHALESKHKWAQEANLRLSQERQHNEQVYESNSKLQESHHLSTVESQQVKSMEQYSEIKRKHQQNMGLYSQHEKLLAHNAAYQQGLEQFAQCSPDILDTLHRNEEQKRRRASLELQESIRMQIEQRNAKKAEEQRDMRGGSLVEDSILRDLYFKTPRYEKKTYKEELEGQIVQHEIKRSQQKQEKKEKYFVGGIFGGKGGRERKEMIEYIDDRLGISVNEGRSSRVSEESEIRANISQNKIKFRKDSLKDSLKDNLKDNLRDSLKDSLNDNL